MERLDEMGWDGAWELMDIYPGITKDSSCLGL